MGVEGSDRDRPRVVVVDDDRLLRELARDALRDQAQVECCATAEEALAALGRQGADLIVSDLALPGLSGLELLERLRRERPDSDFVVLTGHASVESAVEALRRGAADYLEKPIRPEDLARAVGRVLARRRLLAENSRLRDALRTADSCRELLRCLDAGEIYPLALDLALHALGRGRGLALFRRPAAPLSEGVAFRGFGEAEAQALRAALVRVKPAEGGAADGIRVLREGPLHDLLREAGLEAPPLLLVPLRGRQAESGALWLAQQGEPFDEGDLERVALVAGHAEIALQNAERYERAKERAFVDDVTEAWNARYLHQAVEHEIQRAERSGKPLSVLFLDLDRFKLVNDRFGHLVGSQVLRQLARVLAGCVRQVDTLARYGGDEFTIVLVDTELAGGLAVAERIRRTVGETVFEGGRDAPIRLSISIGVAAWPDHGSDREGLLDLADKAMYRAKSLGRNRVCSASELAR